MSQSTLPPEPLGRGLVIRTSSIDGTFLYRKKLEPARLLSYYKKFVAHNSDLDPVRSFWLIHSQKWHSLDQHIRMRSTVGFEIQAYAFLYMLHCDVPSVEDLQDHNFKLQPWSGEGSGSAGFSEEACMQCVQRWSQFMTEPQNVAQLATALGRCKSGDTIPVRGARAIEGYHRSMVTHTYTNMLIILLIYIVNI